MDTLNATPAEWRKKFREGLCIPTSSLASGFVQVNMIAVPADWAYDVLLFAQRNPKPCPVLDVVDAGCVESALALGSDVRTDFPSYRVWEHGVLVEEPSDATHVWREHPDLVTFLIGCSFTFESALREAGIPVRHSEAGRNVPMYETSIPCTPAGRLRGNLVVSMRGIPALQVAQAAMLSGKFPAVHGAPVAVGSPEILGISDLSTPDFGDAPVLNPGDVPVFWACGVTPQAAIMASKPPFAVTHSPGHMFITDTPDSVYMV